jgi:thymidine phosphorylase
MGLIKIGAGRKSIADIVDPTAGITLNSKIGDQISTGDEIGIIFNSNESKLNNNIQLFENCFTIEDMKPKSSTIIVR